MALIPLVEIRGDQDLKINKTEKEEHWIFAVNSDVILCQIKMWSQ